MTTSELRQSVVATAKSWLGSNERDGTHKAIIDIYNSHTPRARGYAVSYTDFWCATFVSAISVQLGLTSIMFPECSCDFMIAQYKAAGRWQELDSYIPEPGDIVMYDWQDNGIGDNVGGADHIGIVCSVSGNSIQVIEGNIANSVDYRTLEVDGKYIRGYCLPDYASKASEGETIYTISAVGEFIKPSEVDEIKAFLTKHQFDFSIEEEQIHVFPEDKQKTIKTGSRVRVKRGAKFYDGKTPIPVVYDRDHVVHSMNGDRVVIAVGGIVVGAVHKDNLDLV